MNSLDAEGLPGQMLFAETSQKNIILGLLHTGEGLNLAKINTGCNEYVPILHIYVIITLTLLRSLLLVPQLIALIVTCYSVARALKAP